MNLDAHNAEIRAYALLSAVGDPDMITEIATTTIPDLNAALMVIGAMADALSDLFDRCEQAGVPVRGVYAENAQFAEIAAVYEFGDEAS